MMPELGFFSLILALFLSCLSAILPWLTREFRHPRESGDPDTGFSLKLVRPLALGQTFFVILSVLCLIYAFVNNDFSVVYVARNSNSSLPLIYKITALWGGHEGSLLLWQCILNLWILTFCLRARDMPLPFVARVLSIMSMISIGFLLYIITVSNPFLRYLPHFPIEGQDLNPLLQDPGLIIHPPLLYMGYVGLSIPFAFALSALMMPHFETRWASWVRPWVLSAFSFLTLGITLGSWWAYYELGWGGWWFWDPVENASLMPWLISIALIHSLIVSDKKQGLQAWTVLLALLGFALSLLGTFLVRSGLLTSVHAFASDPARGLFILIFLGLMIGGAFLVYALKGPRIFKHTSFEMYSRETLLLSTTVCLSVASFSILLGTLYPLLIDASTGRKISVGFPYFNMIFIPLMIPILLMLPLGPFTRWGANHPATVLKQFVSVFFASIALALILPVLFTHTFILSVTIGVALAAWLGLGTLLRAFYKIRQTGIRKVSLGAWGMITAHFGVAVLVLGITLVSHFDIEKEVHIKVGDTVSLQDYQIQLAKVIPIEGSNYVGYQARFNLHNKTQHITMLYPEKRRFIASHMTMTETAIDPGIFRDIYISLGERLEDGSWLVRIYYKPFVRWIWAGMLLIAIGAVIAACKKSRKISS